MERRECDTIKDNVFSHVTRNETFYENATQCYVFPIYLQYEQVKENTENSTLRSVRVVLHGTAKAIAFCHHSIFNGLASTRKDEILHSDDNRLNAKSTTHKRPIVINSLDIQKIGWALWRFV